MRGFALLVASALVALAHAQNATSCFDNPTSYACKSFVMPDDQVVGQIRSLCDDMPNMVGCSLWASCETGGAAGQWCAPFALYGTICSEMAEMRDCTPYNQLCSTAGSVVGQCAAQPPLPGAPTTAQAREAVLAMCGSHSMPGCDTCTARSCPHPAEVLSQVCLGMPGMAQCAQFVRMCSGAGAADTFTALCGGGDTGALPPMKMWMHAGMHDILLFKEWVPSNGGEYAGYCIMCIVGAVFVQWLKAMRVRMEAQWAAEQRVACCDTVPCGTAKPVSPSPSPSPGSSAASTGSDVDVPALPSRRRRGDLRARLGDEWGFLLPSQAQAFRNALRSGFTFVVVFLDYMLMLLVMSFNIGIIFSTVGGFALGALLFGHWGERVGAGSAVAVGSMAPDSENDLEVHFMEATTCCGGHQV